MEIIIKEEGTLPIYLDELIDKKEFDRIKDIIKEAIENEQ